MVYCDWYGILWYVCWFIIGLDGFEIDYFGVG